MRYIGPPDHLVTQLDLYIEERLEDQRELAERKDGFTETEELRTRIEELESEVRSRFSFRLGMRTEFSRVEVEIG